MTNEPKFINSRGPLCTSQQQVVSRDRYFLGLADSAHLDYNTTKIPATSVQVEVSMCIMQYRAQRAAQKYNRLLNNRENNYDQRSQVKQL